jgi:predicted RNA-binding Zn ribbon-like protein
MRLVTLDGAAAAGGQPLFVEFVNTLHWYEGTPIELIGSEAELASWLAEHDLPAHDLAGHLPAVYRLRDHSRALTEALAAKQPPPQAALAALQAALGAPLGRLALVGAATERPNLAFETNVPGIELLAFRVALSLATFLRSGDRRRLKLCANPGCGFAFLDTSTNATRRWCYMRYCGNRLKARAFRRRRSRQPSAPGSDADPGWS